MGSGKDRTIKLLHVVLPYIYRDDLENNIIWDEYRTHQGSFQATTKALDEPSKCLTEPKRAFAAPKCLILYTPEAADSGILHSIVASLRVLSLAGLDHINRRQKSSSS